MEDIKNQVQELKRIVADIAMQLDAKSVSITINCDKKELCNVISYMTSIELKTSL